MIKSEDIVYIGRFLKPHGIKGEIGAELSVPDFDIADLNYIVTDVDGIFVPFFIDSCRDKSSNTVLLTLDGVSSELDAKDFSGKDIYASREAFEELMPESDGGLYLADLVGFSLYDTDDSLVGVIEDFDDSTANLLFRVMTPDGRLLYAPASPDLMTDIDIDGKRVTSNLPSGLYDLN